MKPTRTHYFYAQNWPAWMWIIALPALFVGLMAAALGRPPELAGLDSDAKAYLFLLGVTLLLGACVAALLGPFVLGPLYHYRAELNGYPFQPGDRVEILVGANRGRIVQVVEVRDWQGDLRVDLGEVGTHGARTHFRFAQVIRAPDAEPPAAADPSHAARP